LKARSTKPSTTDAIIDQLFASRQHLAHAISSPDPCYLRADHDGVYAWGFVAFVENAPNASKTTLESFSLSLVARRLINQSIDHEIFFFFTFFKQVLFHLLLL